jgi:hypothetical protein
MKKNLFVLSCVFSVSFLFGQLDTAIDVVDAMWHEFGLENRWYFENLEDYLKDKATEFITVRKVRNNYYEDDYNFYFTINYGAYEITLLKIAQRGNYYVHHIKITDFEGNNFLKSMHRDFLWYINNQNFGQRGNYIASEDEITYEIKPNFIFLKLYFTNGKLKQLEIVNAPDG